MINSILAAFICLSLNIQNNFKWGNNHLILVAAAASFEITPGVLVLDIDVTTNINSNPHIDPEQTSSFLTTTTSSPYGIASIVDPSSVPSYSRGLLGLYHFDTIVDGTSIIHSSGPGDVIIRGSVPCSSVTPLTNPCQNAYLMGDGNETIQPLSQADVKFGTAALNVQHESWAAIQPGPFDQSQPTSGVTVASWIKSDDTVLKGKLWERLYDNFDLSGQQLFDGTNCFKCEFGGKEGTTAKYFYARHCFEPGELVDTNTWMHLACSFDPTYKQLTIYYNGVASQTTYVNLENTDFIHVSYRGIGIGNRGDSNYRTTNGFDGKMDDFALWGRALSSMEIADLYNSNAAIELVEFPVLETMNFIKTDPPTEREFSAITITWTAEHSDAANASTYAESALALEISTDGGKTWCEVSNDVVFTDALHGGDHLFCLFPAVTLKIRARWDTPVTLTSLKATFHPVSPLERSYTNVSLGINLSGVSYGQAAYTFVDMYKSSGGCCWPYIRSGTDENGWPLEIDPVLDTEGGYWKVGRALIGRGGFYPAGEYTLYAEGSGKISLGFDSGSYYFEGGLEYEHLASNCELNCCVSLLPNKQDFCFN